jgi:Xaa-Pro dipeptidase
MNRLIIAFLIVYALSFLIGCAQQHVETLPFPMDENPWPEIRKERIRTLLPEAMQRAGVDSWIVVCRENNNDPLAIHVGGENSGREAGFLFFLKGENVESVAISPMGEATALKEVALHDSVVVIERGANVWAEIAREISVRNPNSIAINSSDYPITDGLSYTQRTQLQEALGSRLWRRTVASTDLVFEWLSVKLPQEVDIMKKAAEITSQLQYDVYKIVVPGKTKDSDIAIYLRKRMNELGVKDAWAPAQNPSVNSGQDRGHSHATDKVIQPGDVIQIDFGIKAYDMWCSDIQRFAYGLKEGETEAPQDIQKYWMNGVTGHRKVLAAMKPGVTGWSVDKVQRDWMTESGSLPVMWGTGHPVGYWAHDAGPALSGAARSDRPSGTNARLLVAGQTFAYDGFFTWQREDGSFKTISVEEMAVVTENGAEYMSTPQDELVLIPSK